MTNRPTRRRFLAGAAALAAWPALPRPAVAAGTGGSGAPDSGTDTRPNILFVLSDSHRAAATGCYGNDQLATPGFDAFAAQGLKLQTAVANTPQCRPYRASLMSGDHAHRTGLLVNVSPHNTGVNAKGQWLGTGRPTLARVFADAGYRCGYVGKWHLGRARLAEGPFRYGFDDLFLGAVQPVHDYTAWTYATGEGETVSGKGRFRPSMESDAALAFIRDVNSQARDGQPPPPWLTVISWGPPHEPLEPPAPFDAKGPVQLPPNVRGRDARRVARQLLPRYYGLIEALDQEFARLLEALDQLDGARDTLVVYTSDHGNQMGSQGLVGKNMPYGESTAVPLLLRWPGRLSAGSAISAPFGTPDILPTLAGLAGVPMPVGPQGRDLSGVLLGQADAPAPGACYLAGYETDAVPWPGWRGVRTRRHLYACTREGPWLLYDLEQDPYQLTNLVDKDTPLRDRLHERTRALMDTLDDAWPAG